MFVGSQALPGVQLTEPGERETYVVGPPKLVRLKYLFLRSFDKFQRRFGERNI